MQKNPAWHWAARMTETAGSGWLTLVVFGAQPPVVFGAGGGCYRVAATGKLQTHTQGLRGREGQPAAVITLPAKLVVSCCLVISCPVQLKFLSNYSLSVKTQELNIGVRA